jgi:hypothetical protein
LLLVAAADWCSASVMADGVIQKIHMIQVTEVAETMPAG